ncbi:MAG: response regulator, partial [Gemmatimonadota bacterium]|nr:response regulator [Gemmatimonadota bacterium]
DEGATFRVHLPTASTSLERTPRHATPSSVASAARDTVLVVDDEPTVRSAVTRYLERLGYQVVSAASAEEALAVIEHAPDRVRLLLTDVVMTGMNGRELAARAVTIRPHLPVILMSGYSGPRSSGAFAVPADSSADALPLLQKPFDLDALESIVRDTLAAAT